MKKPKEKDEYKEESFQDDPKPKSKLDLLPAVKMSGSASTPTTAHPSQ